MLRLSADPSFRRTCSTARLRRCASRRARLRADGSRPTCWTRRAESASRQARDPSRWAGDRPSAAADPDADRAAQIRPRLIDERSEHAKPGLFVSFPVAPRAAATRAQPKQALCGDRGGRAVDRFVVVEGIGRSRSPISERLEPRRTSIPVWDPVGSGGVIDIEIACRKRPPSERRVDRRFRPSRYSSHFGVERIVARNSSSSANPSIAHASPRVQVENGE